MCIIVSISLTAPNLTVDFDIKEVQYLTVQTLLPGELSFAWILVFKGSEVGILHCIRTMVSSLLILNF